MPVLRRRALSNFDAGCFYVHSNLPRAINLNGSQIKQAIHSGDLSKLEQIVLDGNGQRLLGEYSADFKTRSFLKSVPSLMEQMSQLHDAVNSGKLNELESLLEQEESPERRKRLVTAKDEAGVGLLHKAIYYDLKPIYTYLVEKYPHLVSIKDAHGRCPLHYSAMCKDVEGVQKLLQRTGADSTQLDCKQHSAKYYEQHLHELELPSVHSNSASSMRKKKGSDLEGVNVKKSMLRIWIHQRNLTNLQNVIWEGHGSKLLVEHSNNAKVRKFLDAVPHIMGLIRDVHSDVLSDDLETLKTRVVPPIPSIAIAGKDTNGLTALHKAAGLGKHDIAKYLIATYPPIIHMSDNEGRTPLHYAALQKDEGSMTKILLNEGADESALDNRQKVAAYYKNRCSEIDAKVLPQLPDCPRTAKPALVPALDWNLFCGVDESSKTPHESKKIMDKIDEMKNTTEQTVHQVEPSSSDASVGKQREVKPDTPSPQPKSDDHRVLISDKSYHVMDADADADRSRPGSSTVPANITDAVPKSTTSRYTPEKLHEEIHGERPQAGANIERIPSAKEASTSRPPTSKPPVSTTAHSRPMTTEKASAASADSGRAPSAKGSTVTASQPATTTTERGRTAVVNKTASGVSSTKEPRLETPLLHDTKPPSEMQEQTGGHSTGDVGVIEGVVNGENEVETLNEGARTKSDTDPEVSALIEGGNMEQLAWLVLNGDGHKLIGQVSSNEELQSFLENVPVYMSKIRRIHVAARNGSLRELQAALDRRKFAVARDSISPNGASPLHAAIIFGNTNIVRYLAGRFPETVHATDDNGRTPLHYAAVLSDNGHYYNLLMHLGADNRISDKYGSTPDIYSSNQEEFSHRMLLLDFGADPNLASEMMTSEKQGASRDSTDENQNQVDMPFFATEEGRYLASSLGDPLIKGLTEVANKRPIDPIAYLAKYLLNVSSGKRPSSRGGMSPASQRQKVQSSGLDSKMPSVTEEGISNAVPISIDVVTLDPDAVEADTSAFTPTPRDEHGQTMAHFAASRSHARNALYQLLVDADLNIGLRDALNRTARDVAVQANMSDNILEIDKYVIQMATGGQTSKLVELLLDGYDHITDAKDAAGANIIQILGERTNPIPQGDSGGQASQINVGEETLAFLQSIGAFEEKRTRVHRAIVKGEFAEVTALLADDKDTSGSGRLLAIGRNKKGQCALHVGVLGEHEEVVDFIANSFPETLQLGDNLERTALHYAMGVSKMETLSRLLIQAGAQRVAKDLRGRQPSYYFLNKSEISLLQENDDP